jgi:DNA-binding MarR family transcriptional regulator
MPRLTDTQLVILSAASRRRDRSALPLPSSLDLNKGTAASVLKELIKKGMLEERPAPAGAETWRKEDDGTCITLAISDVGLTAIGVEDEEAAGAPTASKTIARTGSPTRRSKKLSRGPAAPSAKPGTKQAQLIRLLNRKTGATIAEISDATGWQAHSVRGAISGTLKKKLGLDVTSDKVEGRGRVYRIAKPSQASGSAR